MWTPDSLRREGPRYLAIVDRIQRDIATGRLHPGMRLPAQRVLAERLGVDLTTVSRAYAEATRRGLITGQVGRGTYVCGPDGDTATAPGDARGQLVDLSLNLPPRIVLDEAERALAVTLRALPDAASFHGLLEYQPNAGRADHREAGAAWIARRGIERPASHVVITSGAQHALTVLLTTHLPAESVVVTESLTYPVFKTLADQLRIRLVGLATDDEGILPESFETACAAGARALYCTPTLQNPTATIMSAARRADIAAIARRYQVLVIEDDTYGMLPRTSPPPLGTYEPERSFFVSSLSKVVAPGLRVAFIAAPSERSAEQLASAVRATSWMATPLTTEIAAQWIRDGVAQRLLTANRADSNARQQIAKAAFAGWRWQSHPEAYHGWLTLPETWSTAEFVMAARQAGIVVSPGDAFAVDRTAATSGVRISLSAARSHAALKTSLAAVVRLLEGGPGARSSLI